MLRLFDNLNGVTHSEVKQEKKDDKELAKLVSGVEWVRISFVNVNGLLLSIAIPPSRFPQIVKTGLPKPYGLLACPWMWEGVPDGAPVSIVGECNLVPDLSTFRVLPYEGENDAMVFGELFDRGMDASGRLVHGERMPYCTRYFMRKQAQQIKDEFGLEVTAGVELEFMLYETTDDATKTIKPIDTLFYEDDRAYRSKAGKAVREMVNTLQTMNIGVYTWHAEVAAGQYEISFAPGPVIEVIDNLVYTKQCINAIAEKHNLKATFLPKPLFEDAGNGLHVHMSLKDIHTGKNIFPAPGTKRGFSLPAENFLAGVLKHITAICGVSMPTTHSYMRVRPGMFASAYACWGYENREACIRMASPPYGEPFNNVEFRPFDGTNNPYLSVGLYLVAGIDGLRNKLELPDPVETDPHSLGEEERTRRGIKPLPASLPEALENLKNDSVLIEALGANLTQLYFAQKKAELAFFKDMSDLDQLKHFLQKF
ncbi:glutamine synthetase/guanido kinase [Gonapodya prolifera JEL478]|uniref:Glutamine synthetase n=1 Tax=Gonapodya prolifera (strain JEL478) TaxID=1344416 RepID=A0A139AWU8_GONPJ|nr:glutamine synthetase/guanido kinase [Gonapodya prolifera JEL478]|eukprot:KXS21179.1 glutamine synthetase/guanido kinase [Gonapodya prolifera JEL478]